MSTTASSSSQFDLSQAASVHRNLSIAELVEDAVVRGEGHLASNGALVAYSGQFTGRTPGDKYIVREPSVEEHIWWEANQAFEPDRYQALKKKVQDYLAGKEVFVVDSYAGADPRFRINVRVVCQKAWHAAFIKTLLRRPTPEELASFQPDWTLIDVCEMEADPATDGTKGKPFIIISFEDQTILIGGTAYAGEMKKSVFTVLNYLLPMQGVMAMHCSANVGKSGDAALFFGLSGTGKTTLSADPNRRLIGDDEHGWTEEGVFNYEGGCYAKCIRLREESEPQIYRAIRFGSVLENVVLRPDRSPDYDDDSITENTRCSYPVEHIEGCVLSGMAGHPKNIFFLTADAFGVLPPISKLTKEQAMEMFLLGYTAKVAGTEAGVKEPQATFSACFGKPFLPLPPKRYAELLGEKIDRHGSQVWLVNTGWSGGPYGVGERISIAHTRALIQAAIEGALADVRYQNHPIFGLPVPQSCPNVPPEILNPRSTWPDKEAYDRQASELKAMFDEQIEQFR
ncbi:MAG: phosphoenolpyruvate carboxykinase (ATP) [Armatimonadetes bacterium]|nr:MAG: phosphoenolpyruvate carboxykinase (ATP) [Armatimonadota bacterium]